MHNKRSHPVESKKLAHQFAAVTSVLTIKKTISTEIAKVCSTLRAVHVGAALCPKYADATSWASLCSGNRFSTAKSGMLIQKVVNQFVFICAHVHWRAPFPATSPRALCGPTLCPGCAASLANIAPAVRARLTHRRCLSQINPPRYHCPHCACKPTKFITVIVHTHTTVTNSMKHPSSWS